MNRNTIARNFYFLFGMVFFSCAVFAQDGYMTCKVTGSAVIASEDGRFVQYSSVTGGTKSGDDLILTYSLGAIGKFFISLHHINDPKKIIISAYLSDSSLEIERTSKGTIFSMQNTSVSFLNDYIRVDNKGFGALYLVRYYKNDWHGVYARFDGPTLYTQNLTFNCRHQKDQMDAVNSKISSQ